MLRDFAYKGLLLALILVLCSWQAVLAQEADVNLNLGKDIVARNTQSSEYAASNAVDGEHGTFWVSGNPAGTYLVVDLGEAKPFNYFSITNSGNAGEGKYYSPKKGRLEGSNDPAAWSDHVNDSHWTLITNWEHENRSGKFECFFEPALYRYVRYYVEEAWHSNVQIREWELKFNTLLSHTLLGTTATSPNSHTNPNEGNTTKLIDGDDATYWISNGAPFPSNPFNVTLHFSQPTYVDTVRLYKDSAEAEGKGPRMIIGYAIYLLDGSDWVKVYETEDDGGLSEAICTFPGRVTQELRLEITRALNDKWAYICSIEARALRAELVGNKTHYGENGAAIFGRTRPGTSAELTVEPGMWQGVATADSSGQLTFTGVQFTPGMNTLRLRSVDQYIIVPEGSTETVAFDPDPLTVLVPEAGLLRLNESIELKFSKPVDRKTVNTGTVRLLNAAGGTVNGFVSFNEYNNSAYFIPKEQLQPETEYTVVVTTDIQSLCGATLTQEFRWSFTTSRKIWRLLSSNAGRSEAYDTGGTYRWNPAPELFKDVGEPGEEISFSEGKLTDGIVQNYKGVGWDNKSGHSVSLDVNLQKTYHIEELRLRYFSVPPGEYDGPYTDRKLEKLEVLYSIDGVSWQRAGTYLDLISNSYGEYWAVVPLKAAVKYLKIQLETSTRYLIIEELELWGDGPGVDCAPPIITNVEPTDGASFLANRPVTIKVNYEEDLPLIDNALTLLLNGEDVTGDAQISEQELIYTVPADQAKAGLYTVIVTLADKLHSTSQQWSFKLVDSSLQIDSVQPVHGAELTTRKPQITVDYSPLVSNGTLGSARMWLNGEEVSVEAAAGTITYQPAESLPLGKHWVMLSLTDSEGKTQTKEWEFFIVSSDPVFDKIAFTVPSEVVATLPFTIDLEALDADGNFLADYEGDFELEASLGQIRILEQTAFEAGKATVKCVSEEPGSLQLKATAESVTSTSPLIFVNKAPEKLEAKILHLPKKIEAKGEVVVTSLFVNQSGKLEVKLLNLQGQLVNSYKFPVEPGELKLHLRGENQQGQPLSNGLYIALLEFQNLSGDRLQLKMPLVIHYLR